jgi:hypothetical protein
VVVVGRTVVVVVGAAVVVVGRTVVVVTGAFATPGLVPAVSSASLLMPSPSESAALSAAVSEWPAFENAEPNGLRVLGLAEAFTWQLRHRVVEAAGNDAVKIERYDETAILDVDAIDNPAVISTPAATLTIRRTLIFVSPGIALDCKKITTDNYFVATKRTARTGPSVRPARSPTRERQSHQRASPVFGLVPPDVTQSPRHQRTNTLTRRDCHRKRALARA